MATINITKWWHSLIGVIPLVTAITGAAYWLDSRHVSSEDSYLQNITIQMLIIEGHILEFDRMERLNYTPSVKELEYHKSNKDKLKRLEHERDCFIGLKVQGC